MSLWPRLNVSLETGPRLKTEPSLNNLNIINIMNAVIFDTNIYREISKKELLGLREKEREGEWLAFANVWVIRELLSHLGDKNVKEFNICRRAVEKLYLHCFDEKTAKLRMMPEVKANLQKIILDYMTKERIKEIEDHAQSLANFVVRVYESSQLETIAEDIIKESKYIADKNHAMKVEFAQKISEAYKIHVWDKGLLSQLIICWLQGRDNVSEYKRQEAEEFLDIPLSLLDNILQKMAPRGLNENNNKHINFLVDFDLISSTKGLINDAPVHFITEEKALIETVNTNFPQHKDYIMNLGGYRKILSSI